jgi:hypothetical protein
MAVNTLKPIVLSFLPLFKHKSSVLKLKTIIPNLIFTKSNKISNIFKVVSSFLLLSKHKWSVPNLKTPIHIPIPILIKGNKILNI